MTVRLPVNLRQSRLLVLKTREIPNRWLSRGAQWSSFQIKRLEFVNDSVLEEPRKDLRPLC
jgi:hypothetical protein